ncbi:two-component sensor histidine kinase [Tepiditoga spiralis]|uniref:histidine kinase n=1 Tax=Tepiditoga spiralis TaxID=2108365 RepID=A0A7G1G9F4_9BACT|nr:HAMP domain-containing sensor histidine kinase [Tepiditoga spiralis]BBE31593.1 two-component sensor histidine kinase [Tepiditoga spiralis]
MEYLNYISEGFIKIKNIKVLFANKNAQDLGFYKNKNLLSIFTFNSIDELMKSILNNQKFECETTIHFFNGKNKFCKIFYIPNDTIIIKDKTESEIIKKVKADFISSISHEIRTPLTVAKGNTQILLDFLDNKKFESNIKTINKALSKIERIIEQLTLLSMAEFGNYTLKTQIFSPNEVYEDVINDLEKKIKEKNIKLIYVCNTEILNGDKFIIYTLIRNLVSNAIKYSFKNSSIKVEIKSNKIIVSDTGIGIKDNEKNRIFERFYRGSEASKIAKGSGLGLSIVKYLCELSNYKIKFDSKWNVGSIFEIYLKKQDKI